MSVAAALLLLGAVQYAGEPLPEVVLDETRGGFQLPNGINVAITVQTQTSVDGNVVLRTVFQANQGAPTLAVYVPKPGETVAVQPAAGDKADRTPATPTITYDRQSGFQVSSRAAMPTVAVGIEPSARASEAPTSLIQIDAAADPVTDAGIVSRSDRDGVGAVKLSGADLSITHFVGNAFGSAIANSGNDRAIDSTTAISIDLSNAGPDVLGSAMLRVQDISADALRGRF